MEAPQALACVRTDQIEAQALINRVVGARPTGAQNRPGLCGLINAIFQQGIVYMHRHDFTQNQPAIDSVPVGGGQANALR